MSWRKFLWLFFFMSISSMARDRGGDDAGNGGFAYKQSIKILEMACRELEHKIAESNLKELNDHPDWRRVLSETLRYDALIKLPKKNQYRGGRKLAMNYQVNPEEVIVLKPYYEAFMGKTDNELEDAALEVEKRLVHEASHIWGYKEKDSETFSLRFMNETKPDAERPTGAIDIKADFCACKNGKPDLINDCTSFCSLAPDTSSSVLYLNTIVGPEISLNPKLGNLANWCNVQLEGDVVAPQCFLSATDGMNKIENIPVKISSNSLTANIDMLSYNKTYILKIYEGRTGSNAQSKEFQLRRKLYIEDDILGALKLAPVNQYTCISFGGTVDSNGRLSRDSYSRTYYYFAKNDLPPPMPPMKEPASIICHDEQRYPGQDSAMYPRLELVPGAFISWDAGDPRFVNENGNGLKINRALSERLYSEYGVNMNVDLFRLINFPNRPSLGSTTNFPLGFIMIPFTNKEGRSFCPTLTEYNDRSLPLFNLLKEYMDDTEGLYIAEKEAETINDNGTSRTIYGTMFITESILQNIGFYVENGVKIRATPRAFHEKTIYYYWPKNETIDPLVQGNRKLFTVRSPDSLNGNVPTGIPNTMRTSDKRIGCVPKN